MRIVPIESVTYLRPYACSSRSDCHKCPSFGRDCHFPHPYKATNEELKSVPYLAELWADEAGRMVGTHDSEAVILSFDEINEEYIRMKNDPSEEYMSKEEFNEVYPNVFEYLRACIDQGLHPCAVSE